MANKDLKRLEELENSGELERYKAATPLIGELRKAGYSNEAIKNIIWHIAAESSWKIGSQEKENSQGGNGLIQLTGDANRKTYSDKLNAYIAENGLNYKKIDLVANRRQLDRDPDMQAVLARMYFDDRKRRGLNYDNFEDVHKALAPKNRNPQDRIDSLLKAGWRKPEDEDLWAWAPAVEPPKPVAPAVVAPAVVAPAVPTLTQSIKSKINPDGTINTTPTGR
jgi:hypothetical protein